MSESQFIPATIEEDLSYRVHDSALEAESAKEQQRQARRMTKQAARNLGGKWRCQGRIGEAQCGSLVSVNKDLCLECAAETRPEYAAIRILLEPVARPMIVELGAHIGEEHAEFERILKRDFCHVMVEADIGNVRRMQPLGIGQRIVVAAISDVCGSAGFYFSDHYGDQCSGSLLAPSGHLERHPDISFPIYGRVRTLTLDDVYDRESLGHVSLLWVDIQGAEAAMVCGGEKALKRTHYMFVESYETEMYRGQAVRADFLKMLPAWKVIKEFRENLLMENTEYPA